jgi:hypothetical protein
VSTLLAVGNALCIILKFNAEKFLRFFAKNGTPANSLQNFKTAQEAKSTKIITAKFRLGFILDINKEK